METMKSLKLAKLFGVMSISLFVLTLGFRFLIYKHLYIAFDSPYGISDVIEFLLGWLLIALLLVSFCIALVLILRGPKVNRIAAAWLLVIVSVIVIIVRPLHDLAARWAI
jgi:hypothetical protein